MAHDEDELVDQNMVQVTVNVNQTTSMLKSEGKNVTKDKGWILFSNLNLLVYLGMPKAWSSYAKPKNFEFVALEDFSEGTFLLVFSLV